MISPQMFYVFDQLPDRRRAYYASLTNALFQMGQLLMLLRHAAEAGEFLDVGFRDRGGTIWIPLTRPGMPDPRPGFPRRDLALIEWVAEWAAGVKHHATADIIEMDLRYPELRNLKTSEMSPWSVWSPNGRTENWLKGAFNRIFRSSRS